MADVISIPQIVWKILNITPQILSQYRTVQDQLLWLIFIPSLVVIFFIYLFATNISYGHKGFRNLFGIAGYLTLILTGWYGKLIPIFLAWWWLWLGFSMILFLFSVVYKPGKAEEMKQIGKAGASAIIQKAVDRRQAAKLVKDIDNALGRYGIDPNIPLTSQPNFTEKLNDKAQAEATRLVAEREKLKRLAREWI